MALNYDNLSTTTLQLVRKRMADAIFKANPTLAYLLMRGRVRTASGGKWIEEPLEYAKNTNVQAYQGYEKLNVAPTEEFTMAKYSWRQWAIAIAISGLEELMNAGPEAVFSLLRLKIKNAERSLKEWMDEKIHAATTTKDLSRDFLGLDELIESSATQSSLGGIDRNANAWWKVKQQGNYSSPITGLAASATALTDSLITLYNDVSKGITQPDLAISTQELYEKYEKDNRALLQLRDTKLGDLGFQNLKFKGLTWMWNENCKKDSATAKNHLYMINTEFLSFVLHTRRNFAMSQFVSPYDQDARVAQILCAGNATLSNGRHQGVGVYSF